MQGEFECFELYLHVRRASSRRFEVLDSLPSGPAVPGHALVLAFGRLPVAAVADR